MGYRISRSADDDLQHIYGVSVEVFGVAQAEDYTRGFQRIFNFLAAFPRAARERAEIQAPIRAYPFKSHVVIYEIDDTKTVVILRVRHAHENWTADPIGDGTDA